MPSQTAQDITASAPQDHIVPGGADDGVIISRSPAESIGDAVDRAALAGRTEAHTPRGLTRRRRCRRPALSGVDPPLVGGRWGTAGPHGIDGRTAAHQGLGQGGSAVRGERLENAVQGTIGTISLGPGEKPTTPALPLWPKRLKLLALTVPLPYR